MNTNTLQIEKLVRKILTFKRPEKIPINSLNMNYKAHFGKLNCWEIRKKSPISCLVATSDEDNSMFPSFIAPDEWDKSKTYNIELQLAAGCSNNKCDWSCNGCNSLVQVVDITNNQVTILRYNN